MSAAQCPDFQTGIAAEIEGESAVGSGLLGRGALDVSLASAASGNRCHSCGAQTTKLCSSRRRHRLLRGYKSVSKVERLVDAVTCLCVELSGMLSLRLELKWQLKMAVCVCVCLHIRVCVFGDSPLILCRRVFSLTGFFFFCDK